MNRFEPRRTPDMNDDVLDYLYFNCGTQGVAIVAVKGYINDWAAYIYAVPNNPSEWQTVNHAAAHGIKMRQVEGEALFPEVSQYFAWRR